MSERLADDDPRGDWASGTPVALLTNGTVREPRGLTSSTYSWSLWTAYCTFMRPTHARGRAPAPWSASMRRTTCLAQGDGRDHAGRVAGVHARLLDVLHDGADVDVLAVADGIDVDLGGVLEEAVDEHRVVGRSLTAVLQVVLEVSWS